MSTIWRRWSSAVAFAIVDEVDSLVDEARTRSSSRGLSGRSGLYVSVNAIILNLPREFELDEKQRTVNLTDAGMGRRAHHCAASVMKDRSTRRQTRPWSTT
jgi:preprotein translocase subunit SecA